MHSRFAKWVICSRETLTALMNVESLYYLHAGTGSRGKPLYFRKYQCSIEKWVEEDYAVYPGIFIAAPEVCIDIRGSMQDYAQGFVDLLHHSLHPQAESALHFTGASKLGLKA